MRPKSRGIGIAVVSAVLLFSHMQLRADQWQFIKAFPDTSVTQGNTVHGLAVDPEGKLWVQFWNAMPGDSVREANGMKTPVRAIYVFDKNGNNVPFSPITILAGTGIHDTLFVTPTERAVTNRGLTRDHQGNILASVFDALYRIDYKTGTVLKKVQPFPTIALTAPAVDEAGDIVIGTVLPGNPLKIFDKDFNYLRNVTDVANGYSRSMAVSKDGKDVYYAGYTLHAVQWYHSANGVLGPYVLADTILKGFDCESFARHPKTNYIWVSAGSGNDMPNRYPGVYTNWMPNTWYAYDPVGKQVVDTIMWMNVMDMYNTRPRAMAFSPAGDTVYLGSFGLPSSYWWYSPVQKFVHVGTFEMKANIVAPDTVKFGTAFLGYSDTMSVSVLNNGNDILTVSNMTLDNAEFGIAGPTSFTLARGLTKTVGVVVTPTSLGAKQATLTILSNAVDSVKRVRFVGVAAAPPLIAVTPDSLTFVVNEGDSAAQSLSIQNSGTGALEWNITLQSANMTTSTIFSLGDGAANISAPRDKFVPNSMFSAGGMAVQVPSAAGVVPNNPTRDASGDIKRITVSAEEGGSIGKIVSSGSSQMIPAVGLPFFDGFESGNFNQWQIDGQSGVREVTNATAAQGAYSFHFQSVLTQGHNQGIHKDFAPGSRPEYISFYVRPGSTSSANAYCVFHGDTLGLEAIWFFARSGHFYINGNVGGDESYTYNALQWYFIEFRNIDWVLKNFDYYVNGVLIKADIPFRNANTVNQLQRLYLYNYDIADAWWDDINVGSSISWLSVSPQSGTIQPGNTAIVEAKIKTANLGSGDFRALLNVNSNDPQSRVKKISVTVHVVPAPHLVVPDSIEFKSTTYVGVPDTFQIELRNTGSEHLIVFNLTSTNPEFSILGTTLFAVPSLTSRNVPVRFNPSSPGAKTATLTITSNDPDSVTRIYLSALAAFPPVMVVTPESLSAALKVGDSLSSTIHISNSTGLGPLSFSVITQEVWVTPQAAPVAPLRRHETVFFRDEISAWPFPQTPLLAKNRSSSLRPSRITVQAKLASYLPLLVKDKIGDGGVADIDEIRGSVSNGKLNISFGFAPGVMLDSVIGGLYIDIDRNAVTGRHSSLYYHDLGVEYFVFYYGKLFSLGDSIRITDTNGTMKAVPYQINGQEIQFSVSLSMLGNDDGAMDLVGISGISSNPTDWAPDSGHVTILPTPSWLAIQPDSGIVGPGGGMDITAKVNTAKMLGGQYMASVLIAGNDPKMPFKNVPFFLKLTGIPKIAVSSDTVDFGKTYLGYKSTKSIVINSVGSDKLIGTLSTDNSRFRALDSAFSISPGDSKSMSFQFIPSATGTVTALMTITSNADTLPKRIVLLGEGVVAPNIKTDSTSFKFAGGNRDTLSSSLRVINTGGSDLVVKISDEEGSGAVFIYAATYNEIHKIDVSLKRIVQTMALPFSTSFNEGLAYSGSEIYINGYSQIYVLNPKDGTTLRVLNTTLSAIDGLAFVNNKLYALHPYLNQIYVLNPLNGAVTDTLNLPFSAWGGLDGANGRLFASGYNAVYEINPADGSLIRTLQLNGNDYFYGLAFTGSRLFLSNSSYPCKIFEIDPSTGVRKDSISFSSYQYWALAGGGPADALWLTENPSTVTVHGGDTALVKIKIAPAGLAKGSYQATIVLSSNDPDSARATIPVTVNILTGVAEETTLPLVFALYQNYPNPFNPSTTIRFGIPEASKVSLKIYDVLGREVATIVDKDVQPGYYAIPFNGANLASGAYFYRIIATRSTDQSKTFVETKKLLLMK
jgi:hypothetical protein